MEPDYKSALKSVVILLRLQIDHEKVARYTAERELASIRLNQARLQLLLHERENRSGEDQMPLDSSAAKRFFAEQDGGK